MGNEQMNLHNANIKTPEPPQNTKTSGLESFSRNKFLEDARYGKLEIFKDKTTGSYIMGIPKSFNSFEDYQVFMSELNMRSQLSHQSMLRILGVLDKNERIPMNGVFKTVIYCEWHDHDLGKELKERSKISSFYSEDEIWYMIETIASLCIFLEDNGLYHGDIVPSNIHITDEGFLKLSDFGLLSLYKNSYQKSLSGKFNSYLTPFLLKRLFSHESNPDYDPVQADVFSFGLTILHIASLVDPLSCYDFYNYQIDEGRVTELIQMISMKYSMNLFNLLRLTLEQDDNIRVNFRDVINMAKINEQGQTIAMEEYLDRKNNVENQVLHRVAEAPNLMISPIQQPQNAVPQIPVNANNQISNPPQLFTIYNQQIPTQPQIVNNQIPQIVPLNGNFPNGIQFINGANFPQNQIVQNENQFQGKYIIPNSQPNILMRNPGVFQTGFSFPNLNKFVINQAPIIPQNQQNFVGNNFQNPMNRILQNVNFANAMNIQNNSQITHQASYLSNENSKLHSFEIPAKNLSNLDLDSRVEIALKQSEETIARNTKI